jgi:hypothetical protein
MTTDTRSRLLQAMWQEIRGYQPDRVRNYPSAARAIQSGASADDISTAMMAASYETAFRLLFFLTAEHAEEGAYDQMVGWTLLEAKLGDDGAVTPVASSALEFVHEDLLMADPSGREGRDLFS